MPSQPTRNILYVFIASPGGLESERQILREVVDEINKTFADTTGWQVEVLGWEDTMPGYGRPQALINGDVDRCHIFIGLLHKRWGQPTGSEKYTSGFEEEFDRALTRRRATGSPEMIMVFKKIEDRADPGKQLQRVLRFREEQIQNKELLFKEIGNAHEWTLNVRAWLSRALLERHSGGMAPSAESPVPASANTVDTEERAGIRDAADTGSERALPQQLQSLGIRIAELSRNSGLESFSELFNALSEFEIARLSLAIDTATSQRFDGEVISNHRINRLYLHRAELEMAFEERLSTLRTLVSDRTHHVPGWYWFEGFGFPEPIIALLFLATSDRESEVRRGALNLLESSGAVLSSHRRKDSKPRRRMISTLLKESSAEVRKVALKYIQRIGNSKDLREIDAAVIAAGSADVTGLVELQTALRILDDPNPVFDELITHESIPTATINLLTTHRNRIGTPQLRMGLRHRSESLRRLSAFTLLERNDLSVKELQTIATDDARKLRILGYIGLARTGVQVDPRLARTRTEEEKDKPSTQDALPLLPADIAVETGLRGDSDIVVFEILRHKSREEVATHLDWLADGWIAYRVLALQHFTEEQQRIRHDLATDFQDLENNWKAKFTAQNGESALRGVEGDLAELRQFAQEKLASSALTGLARHGQKTDVQFARKYLTAQFEFIKLPAIDVVQRFGDVQDVDSLLRIARNSYGNMKRRSAEAALALGAATSADPLVSFLVSGDIDLVRVAIRALLDRGTQQHLAIVRTLLWHEKDEIRMLSVAFLVNQLETTELKQLLESYPREQASYYYNVVCWLDRLLYAPEPYANMYRIEIEKHLRHAV